MKAAEIQRRSLVIACFAGCTLAAAVSWCFDPGELTLSLALLSLLPPLCIAVARATRNGLTDPLAVFAFCFAAYNGVVLMRMTYGVGPHAIPFSINGRTYFEAGLVSGLGSLGLTLGWLFSNDSLVVQVVKRRTRRCTAAFITGTAFYLMGLALYLLQYWQIGGYMASVAMDRGRRFEMLTHVVSLPYPGFVVCGLSLMVYASFGISRVRLTFSVVAAFIWLSLVLLQGDRRLALQMVMALAVVVGTLQPKLTKLRPAAFAAIALGYTAAVLFGQYRTLIYDLAAGRATLRQARVAAASEGSVLGKPEQSELGSPYVSVLYYSSGSEPPRWGSSYAMSIPAVVPKALYPGAKVPAISADLDAALHEGTGPVYGWGFSPIAEGFANFGYFGPLIVMILWSSFFAWLGTYRYRGLAGMILCAALLQEAVNANRIDFRYVYFESTYSSIVAMAALLMMKAVEHVANTAPQLFRGSLSAGRSVTTRRSATCGGTPHCEIR